MTACSTMPSAIALLASLSAIGCTVRVDLTGTGEGGTPPAPYELLASGTDEDLRAIHGCSDRDVWIVGAIGTTLHWDGEALAVVPSPTTYDLRSVSCVRPDEVWAAGDHGTLMRWDGSAWHLYSGGPVDVVGEPLDYAGLARTGSYVWLIPSGLADRGEDPSTGVAYRWDGSNWTLIERGETSANSVFSGGGHLYVHLWNDRVQHWDGSGWSVTTLPRSNASSYRFTAWAASDEAGLLAGTDPDGELIAFALRAGAWTQVSHQTIEGVSPSAMAARDTDIYLTGHGSSDSTPGWGDYLLEIGGDGAIRWYGAPADVRGLFALDGSVLAVGNEGVVARITLAP